jgi:predicted DCC family thiol-disulfide oxidoreductase YuxK
MLALGRILPLRLRDWLYDRVARNRYRLFGRRPVCMIPAPDVRARFLDFAG